MTKPSNAITYLHAPSVILPLGDTKESILNGIRSRSLPERPVFSDEAIAALPFRARDLTAALSLSLYERVLNDANIDAAAAKEIPIIAANSKGGVRAFSDYASRAYSEVPGTAYLDIAPSTALSAINETYGITAPMIAVSSACASSLTALMHAARLLNDYERVIVLAAEASRIPLIEAAFQNLGALTNETVMRPFAANRKGFVIGEGAAGALLSRVSEGATCAIEAYAQTSDVSHCLRFDEQGNAIAKALSLLQCPRPDYVLSHGTATKNDAIEARAIVRVYGADIPICGLKPYFGHTLGASGLIETIVGAWLANEGAIAHFPFSEMRDRTIEANICARPVTGKTIRRFVKLAYGFGGVINAASISVE